MAQDALGDPAGQSWDRLVVALGVVGDEEAFHPRAEDDQEAGVDGRLRLLEVVLRDLAADRDPRAPAEPGVDRPREVAADVVEVHIDPFGAGLFERGAHILALVVDRGVVAVERDEVGLLLGAAGDPHCAAAGDLRQLADELPDPARRRRDDHCVSGPRPRHVEEPEVRRQPVGAEHVQRHRERHPLGHLPQRTAAGHGVLLPPELPDDEVAGREARIVALDHHAGRLRGHHLAHLHGLGVRAGLAHPPPLVRIHGRPEDADEHLAPAGFRDRRLDKGEALLGRKADRALGQRDRPVHSNRQGSPLSNAFRIRRLTTIRCTSSGPS